MRPGFDHNGCTCATIDPFATGHRDSCPLREERADLGASVFVLPFGTVRVCRDCHCLVAGGPTRCGRCAKDAP